MVTNRNHSHLSPSPFTVNCRSCHYLYESVLLLCFVYIGSPTAHMNSLSDDEIQELKERLYQLQLEHRDMDELIQRLYEEAYVDQLQVSRLKRRKLQIKDAITRLESRLIPDLNA